MKWVSARGQQAAFRIGAGWDGGGKEKRLKAVGPCPPLNFADVSPPIKAVWVEIEICRPSRDVQRPPPARVAWIEIG